jgi:hypothetical protein
MAKVYNIVGSLKTVLSHLNSRKISDFQSLDDILNFQKQFHIKRKQIILDHDHQLRCEKNLLTTEIPELKDLIHSKKTEIEFVVKQKTKAIETKLSALPKVYETDWQALKIYWTKVYLRRVIETCSFIAKIRIGVQIRKSTKLLEKKNKRYSYLDTQFEDAVNSSAKGPLSELERKKDAIDEIESFISGAIGEIKVAQELTRLPDDCYVINDFKFSFPKAVYHRNSNTYIKSIQIDHVLISPAGVFAIETKNWSKHSISSLSMRSPVEQIQRSGFALFLIISNKSSNNNFLFNSHHWGNKKIPIRNAIIFLNNKPKEEFEFVKLLALHEVPRYINYFKPIFSKEATAEIAEFLVSITEE